MRAVVQRVTRASLSVDGERRARIGAGLTVLLGVGRADAERLWAKIAGLRIMADEDGRANRSLVDARGELLVISQFTLFADCRRGRRPSFSGAADSALAAELYEYVIALARLDVVGVETGVFGAHMRSDQVADGPMTIVLDTADL